MPMTELEDLLSNPADQTEYIKSLDYAMNSMVNRLRNEPGELEEVLASYDSLYLLKKSIENLNANENGDTGN
jgi:hypothetical protein